MKRLVLLSLLLSSFAQAQIVNIPDPAFKNALLALGVDTNLDGEISVLEATIPTSLELNNLGISDATGIQAFTNVTYFTCSQNQLTSLDVSGMANLQTFWCDHNQLTNLNIAGCTALYNINFSFNALPNVNLAGFNNLIYIYGTDNHFTSLNLSGLPLLETINLQNNQISSFTFNNLPALKYFYVDGNALTTVDLTSVPSVWVLTCNNNQITSINVSAQANLWSVRCVGNQLTALEVSNKPFLADLYCDNNQLTSLDLTGDTNMLALYCSNNQIATLTTPCENMYEMDFSGNQMTVFDFSGMPNLTKITCNNNLLTAINVNGLSLLTKFFARGNAFTEIDLSPLIALDQFDLSLNPNMLHINLKNGHSYYTGSYIFFPDSGPLQYICADDFNIGPFSYMINNWTNLPPNSVQINPYCNFIPGGNVSTITGTIRFDVGNDGCDSSDPVIKNLRVNQDTQATFTTADGSFHFYTSLLGSFAFQPVFENPYFTSNPVQGNALFSTGGETSTQDFCITANGIRPDVEVLISPVSRVRPGFEGVYAVTYKNKGNQTVSGTVSFQYGFTRMDFLNATPTPDSQSDGLLQFNYSNLLPFETRRIEIHLLGHTPSGLPLPLNVGDMIDFNASVSLNMADETPADNNDVYAHVVQGSYDPNNIICLEGSNVAPTEIGNYLHYEVNFENTGTADAENIVVRDIIDTNKYDIESLQVIDASHEVMTRINGNVAEFIFANINLQPSTDNSQQGGNTIGGHGNVLFKVKSKQSLNAGDAVNNRADIFFDYNFPVVTNDAVTTFALLANAIVQKDDTISVYPNPAQSVVHIKAASSILSMSLYDIQGRILETKTANEKAGTLDITSRAKGIYFLKVTTENGASIQKIIKE